MDILYSPNSFIQYKGQKLSEDFVIENSILITESKLLFPSLLENIPFYTPSNLEQKMLVEKTLINIQQHLCLLTADDLSELYTYYLLDSTKHLSVLFYLS